MCVRNSHIVCTLTRNKLRRIEYGGGIHNSPHITEQIAMEWTALTLSDADLEERARDKFRSIQAPDRCMRFIKRASGERVLTMRYRQAKEDVALLETEVNFGAAALIARDAEKERAKFAPSAWVAQPFLRGRERRTVIDTAMKVRPQLAPFIANPVNDRRLTPEMVLALDLVGLPPWAYATRHCMFPLAPPNPAGVGPRKKYKRPRHYCAKCRQDVPQTKWWHHLKCHLDSQ
jgi:hypothetical protein